MKGMLVWYPIVRSEIGVNLNPAAAFGARRVCFLLMWNKEATALMPRFFMEWTCPHGARRRHRWKLPRHAM
jgi:hypothetical protein